MIKNNILLSVSNLNVKFDGHVILDNVSFEIKRDSTLAIIGPNGAGKTVLFRAILGLIPYEGKVSWAPDVKIGYVPQRFTVSKDLPLTVSEFLSFKEKDGKKITQALESVGFKKGEATHLHDDKRILKTRMGNLSGGELQRILIAYAILGKPNILLFDEPTAGVDVVGEKTVYSLIHNLQKEVDLAVIFISHEFQVVYKYADEVLSLNRQKISLGVPQEALDKASLEKLYGEEIHLYIHHTDHNHEH